MGDQIAAHEAYLVLAADLVEAEASGDGPAARRLRRELESAKRRWHKLAREAVDAARHKRPRVE